MAICGWASSLSPTFLTEVVCEYTSPRTWPACRNSIATFRTKDNFKRGCCAARARHPRLEPTLSVNLLICPCLLRERTLGAVARKWSVAFGGANLLELSVILALRRTN